MISDPRALGIYALAVIFAAVVGHYVVQWVLSQCRIGRRNRRVGQRRAEAILGIIERTFTVIFVVQGQYLGIAILLTATNVLVAVPGGKKKLLAMRQLIRTLSSVLFAFIVGLVAKYICALLIH
jgi:hypothetical protein